MVGGSEMSDLSREEQMKVLMKAFADFDRKEAEKEQERKEALPRIADALERIATVKEKELERWNKTHVCLD